MPPSVFICPIPYFTALCIISSTTYPQAIHSYSQVIHNIVWYAFMRPQDIVVVKLGEEKWKKRNMKIILFFRILYVFY